MSMNKIMNKNINNIENLWNDPFYTLVMETTKILPNNVYTIDELVNSMNSDIKYKLVDSTKTILGDDNRGNKIFHVMDDSIPNQPITNFGLSLLKYLPISDNNIKWKDLTDFEDNIKINFPDSFLSEIVIEDGVNIANRLGQYIIDGNFTEYYNYLATEGIGAHLLKYNDIDDTYDIDLLAMSRYSVRDNFLPYGAKAIFDNQFQILKIQVAYTPYCDPCTHEIKCCDIYTQMTINYDSTNTEEWQFAHNVFTASLITYVTIKDHLMDTHMLGSDNLLYTYYKYCNKVGRTDDLSQFIEPFIFGTAKINTAATQILFGKNNALNRLFAFDDKGMCEFINDIAMNHQRIRQIDLFEINGTTGKTPFTRDMEKYWNIIYVFVTEFVNTLSQDQMINFYTVINSSIFSINYETIATEICDYLTYHLLIVTIWHQFIGTMAPYTFNPYACRINVYADQGSACMPDSTNLMCRKYESFRAMVVTAITSRQRFPKITDIPDVHMDRLKGDWRKFQNMLNQETFEVEILQPDETECSVAF